MTKPDPVPDIPLARRARDAARMTQEAFAEAYGLDVSAVRNWEAGRREPDRAARVLLRLIEAHPVTIAKLIGALDRILG
jgi:putative transcriptional regulator